MADEQNQEDELPEEAETDAPDVETEAEEPDVEALQAEIEELKAERLRALAEAENANKRADKRIQDNTKYAVSNFAKGMLTVADNLERALLAAPEEMRAESDTLKNLAVGIEMTQKELQSVLQGAGVRRMSSEGEIFDPNHHQAMQEVEDSSVPAGSIVQVMAEGYHHHDRLLRPAMVIIAKGGPKPEPKTANSDADEDGEGVDTEV